jgi:hypothetical protein
MRLIQTKGKIEKGHLIIENNTTIFPKDGDVEVVVIWRDQNPQESLTTVDPKVKKSFEDAGIHNREQVLDLIRDVKREIFEEKFGQ